MIKKIIAHIKSQGLRSALVYTAGRFVTVRRLRKLFRTWKDGKSILPDCNNLIIFENSSVLEDLDRDGIATGIRLSPYAVERLSELARDALIDPPETVQSKIHEKNEIERLNKINRNPICIADARSPLLEHLTRQIAQNSHLLDLARKYLRGGVKDIELRLQWNFVVTADEDWRESQKQTVKFHYDVHALDFVFVFFYITDCDCNSGAHEIIEKTHKSKPLWTLLRSAKQSEAALHEFYGTEAFKIIEGPAGFGFMEDSSIFHRIRPPLEMPRLALQIRYS